MPRNTYVALDKVTTTGSVSSIDFTSISSLYTDLVLVFNGTASGSANLNVQVNGDTGNNYSFTALYGTGSSIASNRGTNTSYIRAGYITTAVSGSILNFQNYTSTSVLKTVLTKQFASGADVESSVSLWRNTNAITSIKVYPSSGTFASGCTASLYGVKIWTPETTPKATGGYVYEDSTYYYHTFLSSGTFTPSQSLSCDYLVIAGGGGGGYDTGGGGGAGGLRSTVGSTGGGGTLETTLSLSATGYAITVGAGGAGALTGSRHGSSGTDSILSTITSTGGGGGGDSSAAGYSGGSGGGTRNSGSGGAGTSNQGYAGGSASHTSAGSGGGGAGTVGASTVATNYGGAGGNGVQITALSIPTNTGFNGYYAGGGGGGSNATPPTVGGAGGGGQGGTPGGLNIKPGVSNTGSGGGGCGGGDSTGFGNGGSGLVIIRYAKA